MATILDSLLGSCAKKLQDIITEKAILILGVKKDLIELQRRINQIQCFLKDAERRSIEDSAARNWLAQLKDVVYEADDIIDLANYKGSILLQENNSSSVCINVLCNGLSISSCLSNFQTRHEVAVMIRSLNRKIESISKDKVFLSLVSTEPFVQSSAGLSSTLRKSSDIVEPNLVGKEVIHACTKVVDLVLVNKDKKSYKLAIVGTGGIGKTTLAQKIYNDQKIQWAFSEHAWVCVSRDYSEVALLREVLRNIAVYYNQDESIGELQSKLRSAIKNKRYFFVLDDVWKSAIWTDVLRVPLDAAATGIILFTTRLETVALEIGADNIHQVGLMSEDVGWDLLWKAMNISEEKQVHSLQDIGTEIVRKCGGLPLAIKLLARVLASKDKTRNEWKKILSKDAWSISNLPSEITGALYLSYEELPHYLKQCFVYCAVFHEDEIIFREDIVRMWVAEGFIEEKDGQLLEDTAEEYYYELIYRNLLQPDNLSADQSACIVHDLLWQLACYLSREECFIGDPESLGVNTISKFRRISVVTMKDMMVLPGLYMEQYKVRTCRTSIVDSLRVDNTFFKRIQCIRVLDLTNSIIHSVPNYIEDLIHLRLLDLDDTDISYLPESIGSLRNLEILNLQRCKALQSLPSTITKLCNLRRLGLLATPINQVPKGIGELKFLNDLEGFPIGCSRENNTIMQDGWNLEELSLLFQLRRLDMIKLERATSYNTYSLLEDKAHLKVLRLWCSERLYDVYTEEEVCNIERTFELLLPPLQLEHLAISGFFGRRYPTWLASTTYLSSLKYLNIIDCMSFLHLPSIGQLSNLKYLRIEGATAVTKIGSEFLGCGVDSGSTEKIAFPKLELLVIQDMPNLDEWSFVDEVVQEETSTCNEVTKGDASSKETGDAPRPVIRLLPCLKELYLVCCPKLRALPQQLGHEATRLEELQLREVRSVKVVQDLMFLSKTLLIKGCELLETVSNLPRLRDLRVSRCPNLRHVNKLRNLEQLGLHVSMRGKSSPWVSGLQQLHQERYGTDLDVYTWD